MCGIEANQGSSGSVGQMANDQMMYGTLLRVGDTRVHNREVHWVGGAWGRPTVYENIHRICKRVIIHRTWVMADLSKLYIRRIWTVFTGGAPQTWVRFPTAVFFLLLVNFSLTSYTLDTSFASYL
jgi:hypothetical protein